MRHVLLLGALAACASEPPPPAVPVGDATRCVGSWTLAVDGEVVESGFQVLDAKGRVIEELLDAPTADTRFHTWQIWETDAAGTDRLRERSTDADADDVADDLEVHDWRLDDRLRLAWDATYRPLSPTEEHRYAYDERDERVREVDTSDGTLLGSGTFTWVDGRLVETVSSIGDQEFARVENEYTAPPPALDHLERWTFPWPTTQRKAYDAEGRLLRTWFEGKDGEELLEALTYDDQGRVVDEVSRSDGGEGTTEHTTSTWDDDGHLLLVRRRTEHADGTVERSIQDWDWDCE